MKGKLINNGKIYSEPFEVTCFYCSPNRELSPSDTLKITEHAADKHLSAYCLSYEEMLSLNTVFLLNAIQLKVIRPAKMNELLTIRTWQRGIKNIRYFRDAVLLDESGAVMAECVQNWFIADPVSHRIKRPSEFPEYGRIPSTPELALDTGVISIHKPENTIDAGIYRVVYSDLDYNHHMNNTRYADIAQDFIPGGIGDKRVKELKLIFHGEALPGDSIELKTARNGDTVYVSGEHKRGNCFEAELILSD